MVRAYLANLQSLVIFGRLRSCHLLRHSAAGGNLIEGHVRAPYLVIRPRGHAPRELIIRPLTRLRRAQPGPGSNAGGDCGDRTAKTSWRIEVGLVTMEIEVC